MFAKTIIDSDAFLDMPLSSQALYFHLSMRADDDGFLNNAKKVVRTIGANQNDYDLLLLKGFIIQFEDGICVIKHWRIHNYIASDRYKPTMYKEEKSRLFIKENKTYTLTDTGIKPLENSYTKCIQVVDECDTQNSLDKNRLVEDSKEETLVPNVTRVTNTQLIDYQLIIDTWNDLALSKIANIVTNSTRQKMIKSRVRENSFDDFIKAINNVSLSDFLKGKNDKGWIITFDWFIKPNNFIKVLEGNYTTNKSNQQYLVQGKQTKIEKFNSMDSHNWDFDEIERLERERIDKQLEGQVNG